MALVGNNSRHRGTIEDCWPNMLGKGLSVYITDDGFVQCRFLLFRVLQGFLYRFIDVSVCFVLGRPVSGFVSTLSSNETAAGFARLVLGHNPQTRRVHVFSFTRV